jgi:hypothetical protein
MLNIAKINRKILIYAAVILIGVVAGGVYWYDSAKNGGQDKPENKNNTEVTKYNPPEELPQDIKKGFCWSNSIAQPYREDAWRCMLEPADSNAEGVESDQIFDPCFSIASKDAVVCGLNPISSSKAFQLLETQPLPVPQVTEPKKENWGWLLELSDGTLCAPFTSTVPVVDGQSVYFACGLTADGQNAVLLGELKNESLWRATEAVIAIENNALVVKESKEVAISKVWQ